MAAETEYTRRVAELSARRFVLQSRERLAGYSQLGLAAFCLVWILFRLRHLSKTDLLLLIPIAVFVALAILHGRLIREVASCSRAIRFYEQGLARLDGSWAGKGAPGEHFLEPAHPYARDLDLFGRASLFELLCTARTRAGEETLAQWLLVPATPETVRERQAAAVELSDRLGFRERLATLGKDVALGVRPKELLAWGEAAPLFPSGIFRLVIPVLASLWALSLRGWQFWGGWELLVLVVTLVNLGISYRFRTHLGHAAHAAEEAGRDLNLLSQVLAAFEREPFTSPRLLQLQARLNQSGVFASRAIAKLNWRVEYLESAHNLFVRIFDPVVFYRLQFVLAAESWRRRFGPSLRVWLDTVGELEVLAALGGYTYEHPADVFPEFATGTPVFDADNVSHVRTMARNSDRTVEEGIRGVQGVKLGRQQVIAGRGSE